MLWMNPLRVSTVKFRCRYWEASGDWTSGLHGKRPSSVPRAGFGNVLALNTAVGMSNFTTRRQVPGVYRAFIGVRARRMHE